MFKKILALISTIVLITPTILIDSVHAGSNDGYFIVTAYYSPLPNQSKYIMGNYEDEVKMNGQWYRWAGWKKVFSSMLAAPWIYSFGTKIYLEWLGIWEVSDRWGAIVKAWERNFKYDRIDLWVGYWEEGLRRAMYWGKRTIKWHVVKRWNNPTINIKKIPSPKWATAYLPSNKTFKKKIVTQKNNKYPFFNYWIWTKSKKESIVELQKFLKKIGLYNWKINWIYSTQLMNNIYYIQTKNNIVKDWSDINAGYWSYKTRELIWKKYQSWEFNKKENLIKITKKQVKQDKISLTSKTQKKEIKSYSQTSELIDFFNKKIENKEWVKRLQRILKKLWYYNWEINWEYSQTRATVLEFQIKNKIIKNKFSLWAWNYWPATRKTLHQIYKQYWIEKEKKKKQAEQIEYNNKKNNQQIALAKQKINTIWNIKFWDISPQVREFQIILSSLWFFNHKDTAIFWAKTKDALIKYQLDRKLITDSSQYWAGLFWPKTRKSLIEDLSKLK